MAEQSPERLSSRKFMSCIGVFLASGVFGWFKPEFVGTAQVLFTFWTLLFAIYFGANVTSRYHEIKNGK